MSRISLSALALAAFAFVQPVQSAEPLTVFAAASMTDALNKAGQVYGAEAGPEIRFSFASSSTLAKQIEQGAPADLFISAAENWMDYLAQRDLIVPDSRAALVSNGLVLVAPEASALKVAAISSTTDLLGMLGTEGRLAVGDPDHVPAGIYAKEALTSLGLWAGVESRLARADNVRAALALVARGEVPLGIVYSTDAAGQAGVKVLATFPPSSHRPIRYPVAIVKGRDSADARAFLGWLKGAKAMAILREFGFIAAP